MQKQLLKACPTLGTLITSMRECNKIRKNTFGAYYLHLCEWEPNLPYCDLILRGDMVAVFPTFRGWAPL
jgi:hypothetical protein